jgi:5-methylcytosine-specific restriction protein A
MAKRFADTKLSRERWFRVLKPAHKCAVRFLFDECDNAGVWSIDEDAFEFFIGESIAIKDLITAVNADGKPRIELIRGDKLFIPGFVPFQFGQLRDSNPMHLSVIALMRGHGLEPEVESGPSPRPSAVLARLSAKKRQEVMYADAFICSYCGTEGTPGAVTVDHIVPRAKGGDNADRNLTTICVACNSKKSDLDAREFITRHGLESKLSASLRSKLALLGPNKGLNAPMEKEEEKEEETEEEKEGGVGETGAAPDPAPPATKPLSGGATRRCIETWQKTLEHYKQPRPLIPGEDVQIARAIQRWGKDAVELALIGIRHEKKSDSPGGFDPSQHVSLNRVLDPERFARFVGLGAAEVERKRKKFQAMTPFQQTEACAIDPSVEPELTREQVQEQIRKGFAAAKLAKPTPANPASHAKEPETPEEIGAAIEASLARAGT